jgi:hypothetical protein
VFLIILSLCFRIWTKRLCEMKTGWMILLKLPHDARDGVFDFQSWYCCRFSWLCLADDTTNYPLCTTFSTQSLVESARRSGTLFDYCWILELFQASTNNRSLLWIFYKNCFVLNSLLLRWVLEWRNMWEHLHLCALVSLHLVAHISCYW